MGASCSEDGRERVWWGYLWSIDLPPGATSVTYDSDGSADTPELASGNYTWEVEIRDADGNSATLTSSFDIE